MRHDVTFEMLVFVRDTVFIVHSLGKSKAQQAAKKI